MTNRMRIAILTSSLVCTAWMSASADRSLRQRVDSHLTPAQIQALDANQPKRAQIHKLNLLREKAIKEARATAQAKEAAQKEALRQETKKQIDKINDDYTAQALKIAK